jgi:hypothetical protein
MTAKATWHPRMDRLMTSKDTTTMCLCLCLCLYLCPRSCHLKIVSSQLF